MARPHGFTHSLIEGHDLSAAAMTPEIVSMSHFKLMTVHNTLRSDFSWAAKTPASRASMISCLVDGVNVRTA